VTDPRRPEERDDRIRFPDARPFRRIQLATAALIVVAVLVTLLSDKRPAEVRYGALIGVAVLILVVLWATRRRRARRAPPPGQNARNAGDFGGNDDRQR
jgi:hypothetical protein